MFRDFAVATVSIIELSDFTDWLFIRPTSVSTIVKFNAAADCVVSTESQD